MLEIDSNIQHDYDQHDINFLTGFANILAEAVATATRMATLQTMVEEKDRLLDQKMVLAEELQHRVRNNLQLISGMLNKQLGDTPDVTGQRGLKAIARRVTTLAQVYDHLLGSELDRTTDFGGYVKSLCLSLANVQADSAVTLTCDSETVILDLDVVTALGIVLAELVTNSYEHAFAGGAGAIAVSVRPDAGDAAMATMTVSDNGQGSKPGAENKRHGIGLVRRLIEQVQGIATVETELGTVWSIRFPMDKAVQTPA